MEERFEVYKREVVEKFYKDYFRNYGRQIVLVDVLGALLAGREAFEDTRLATEAILESFRYGQRTILSSLIGSARVEKVLFAATKADHIPDLQRDHLAALLRNMAALPALEARSGNADIDVTTLASVASTVEGTQEVDGQRVQVVIGRPVGSGKQAKFFGGQMPIRPPRAEEWGTPFLDIPGVRAALDRSGAGRRHPAHQSRSGARIPDRRPAAMSDTRPRWGRASGRRRATAGTPRRRRRRRPCSRPR